MHATHFKTLNTISQTGMDYMGLSRNSFQFYLPAKFLRLYFGGKLDSVSSSSHQLQTKLIFLKYPTYSLPIAGILIVSSQRCTTRTARHVAFSN